MHAAHQLSIRFYHIMQLHRIPIVYIIANSMKIFRTGFYASTKALQPVATCRQSPYLRLVQSATKPSIIIVMSFSLRRHSLLRPASILLTQKPKISNL